MTGQPVDSDALRESRARIVASSNAARQALERRLHDGPQQHLVAMAVKLTLIENAIDSAPDDAKVMLAELRGEVQATVQQLRDIASAIFPPLLGDRGLAEALRAAAAREGKWADIDVDGSAAGRYATEIEAGMYFAAVDAMHYATGPLTLRLAEADAVLEMTLTGEVPAEAHLHIADWIQNLGGSCERAAGEVVVRVPLQ